MQVFLTDTSLLIVSLFEKLKEIIQLFYLVFQSKELDNYFW